MVGTPGNVNVGVLAKSRHGCKNMKEKVGLYLVIYLLMVLAMLTVLVWVFAYVMDFEYFFWNSGAVPFSAWWNLMVEYVVPITLLSLLLAAPATWYMLK